ncbi:hypothetical protein TNCV_1903011 [Trichonephila clavipes]|nr:hypothetical protein TNCV_1903011 [Trichonephila clavipes]
MCDTLRRLAATKILFITVQLGNDFRNDVYVDGRSFFIELPHKVVSTSATFVFNLNSLSNRFLSATDPVSWNRCTKRVIVDAFGAVSPGISAGMLLLHGNEIS